MAEKARIFRRHDERGRFRLAAIWPIVAAVALLLASGPVDSGGSATDRGLSSMSVAHGLFGIVDEAARAGRGADDVAGRLYAYLDDVMGRGRRLTSDEHKLLASLRPRSPMLDIQLAGAAAEAAARSADVEAVDVARTAMRQSPVEAFATDVEAVTKDVVKSTGCDYVASALFPEERTEIARGASSFVPSAQAIEDAAIKRLRMRWEPVSMRKVVDWAKWSNGVIGVATRMADLANGTIEADGRIHSRAFYHYLKVCHAPPR